MKDRLEELFGLRVRELRAQRKLTQEELAERACIHRTYLASIEAGRRNVALVNIVYLARALDIAPSELFAFVTPELLKRLPRNNRNATRARREK